MWQTPLWFWRRAAWVRKPLASLGSAIFYLCLAAFPYGTLALAGDLPYFGASPMVRVGLMRFSGSRSVVLRALPGATLIGDHGDSLSYGPGPWTMTVVHAGVRASDAQGHILGTVVSGAAWRLQTDTPESEISVESVGGRAHHYRGSVEVKSVPGGLLVVNELAIETYLRGVVASEIGATAPIEAMKAQAVAARTFALCSLGRWVRDGYDVRDTTDSQAYNGVDGETNGSDEAVQATEGWILTVNGQPITAQFSADCGGATTPGAGPDDCPHSIVDADAHALQANVKPHAWALSYSPERLAGLLARSPGIRRPGILDKVEIIDKDISGRVRRLRLTWRKVTPQGRPALKGTGDMLPAGSIYPPATEEKGNAVPSDESLYIPPDPSKPPPLPGDVSPDPKKRDGKDAPLLSPPVIVSIATSDIAGNTLRTLLGPDILRSTLFTVRRTPTGEFILDGKGWGHGRGMCQAGAVALAGPVFHYIYQAILLRYYAGASITRVQYPESEEGGDSTRRFGTGAIPTYPAPAHYLAPIHRGERDQGR